MPETIPLFVTSTELELIRKAVKHSSRLAQEFANLYAGNKLPRIPKEEHLALVERYQDEAIRYHMLSQRLKE